MKKRIILLLDGTWNDAEFDQKDTNIVRLRNHIAVTLAKTSSIRNALESPNFPRAGKMVQAQVSDEQLENIVFYERGVGTNFFDRWAGGIAGSGLDDTVRPAYRFLSFHYHPGDEVFVFGFSRGAYTARTLLGFIGAAGLLRREACTRYRESVAWSFYRMKPHERYPGAWADLTEYVHDRDRFKVACIGLFDTVGALGIPLTMLRRLNRDAYEFHSVDLSSISQVNLHALAIDEQRLPFQASVWRRPAFRQLNSVTEQVWFPGVHADIGGGNLSEAERRKAGNGLDDITLDWMLKRLKRFFPHFPCDPAILGDAKEAWADADQHFSRRGAYRLYPRAIRALNAAPPTELGIFERAVCCERNAVPVSEMLHISALQRVARKKMQKKMAYAPRNVLSSLGQIRQTYSRGSPPAQELRVVGWDGEPFDPWKWNDQEAVSELIANAEAAIA